MALQLLLLMSAALISSATPADVPAAKTQDLVVAMEEMQHANYFTFVMLINMSPLDQKLTGNVTFLMPNDKMLSRANMVQESVNDFLLRHSIPSALLFEHLERIPSGSSIPSSRPDYMLQISNSGRRSYFLNNVKISSPNLCTAGYSIRCHGIDGVLNLQDNNPSLPSCSNISSPVVVANPPTTSSPSTVPSLNDPNGAPVIAPQPSDSSPLKSSGSSRRISNPRFLCFLFIFGLASVSGVFRF